MWNTTRIAYAENYLKRRKQINKHSKSKTTYKQTACCNHPYPFRMCSQVA